MTRDDSAAPKRTAFYDLHLEAKARMVPFAGYEMPVQYPAGIMKEHLHARDQAGLFDVSHMGQIIVSGEGVAAALEQIIPIDVGRLFIGFISVEKTVDEQSFVHTCLCS